MFFFLNNFCEQTKTYFSEGNSPQEFFFGGAFLSG